MRGKKGAAFSLQYNRATLAENVHCFESLAPSIYVQPNMACKTTRKMTDNIWHRCCPIVFDGAAVGASAEGSDVEIPLPFWADLQVSHLNGAAETGDCPSYTQQ